MKKNILITSLTALSLSFINLQAQTTTMCYKENHKSMSTIESVNLDGGKCDGKKSIKQMKEDGWLVDDIKITTSENGKDYIYLFKKNVNSSIENEEALTAKILAKIEAAKIAKEKEAKEKFRVASLKNGKKTYTSKCQNCHGEKAELEPMTTSRPLKDLTFTQFEAAIFGYNHDDYDRGAATVMSTYAKVLDDADVKNIYFYIESLKKQVKK